MKIQVAASFIALGVFALPGLPSHTWPSSRISSARSVPHPDASDGPKTSKACSINDENIWTRANWQKGGRNMSKWFTNWYKSNMNSDDHLDETFAAFWGLGPSFSCDIDDECTAPRCSDLKRPGQAQNYENAAMFLASMANFNNQYTRIYSALDMVKIDFGSIQSVLQQTFYPGVTPKDMESIQGLNGGLTAIGLASAWSGPLSPLVNTAKEVFGGISRGLNPILMKADKSVENLAEISSIFTGKIDKIRAEYAKFHDQILKEGIFGHIPIDTIFKNGSYVDDREVPILHDIRVEDLRTYIRNMFFANIVNNAWIKQGAYIYSRKMSEENCKNYTRKIGENTQPQLCYNGRIYFLNKYLGATIDHSTGVSAVPGWKDLEKEVGVTVHNAMVSSIEAFDKGGYTYNSSNYIDEIFDGSIKKKVELGSRYPGLWTIPVCEVESSEQFKEANLGEETSLYWSTVDENHTDEGNDGVQICLCAQAKDHNGVSIKKLEDSGSTSFRALLDAKEHRTCDFGDHGLGF